MSSGLAEVTVTRVASSELQWSGQWAGAKGGLSANAFSSLPRDYSFACGKRNFRYLETEILDVKTAVSVQWPLLLFFCLLLGGVSTVASDGVMDPSSLPYMGCV